MSNLNIGEDLKKFIVEDRTHLLPSQFGHQWIFRFPNDFGASLISGGYRVYGEYEIGVIEFHGPDKFDFELTYSTPITNDVVGYLNIDGVKSTLTAISRLKKRNKKK